MSKTNGLLLAGVALVQPYEAGHMSSFSVAQNRPRSPGRRDGFMSRGGDDHAPFARYRHNGPNFRGGDDHAPFARFRHGMFIPRDGEIPS